MISKTRSLTVCGVVLLAVFPRLPRAVVNRHLSTGRCNGRRMLRATVLSVLSLSLAVAQSAPSSTPQSSSSSSSSGQQNGIMGKIFGWVGPDQPSKLTEKQRFQNYLLYTAGPVPLIGELGVSAVNQWTNSPKEWGQGWDAFGKRYGSNLAYNGIRQTVAYGLSAGFREDNRYFASNKKGFWPRTKYAVISTFTARHPNGDRTFSVSTVAGVAAAASISSIWGPPSWKGVGNISEIAAISFATTAGFNIFREFVLDVFHRDK